MTNSNEEYISPHWEDFHKLWRIVAIILLVLLLLLWVLGYGPGGKNCTLPVAEITAENDTPVVLDKIAPVLTLNEPSVIRVVAGNAYVDAGATAFDNIDGDIIVTIRGTVDTSTVGEYTLTYGATDQAGNTTVKTRTIIVDVTKLTATGLPTTVRLYFEHNSTAFPANIEMSLAPLIAWLQTHDTATAVISGFHSSVGRFDYNQKLAKERAEAIRKLLQDVGISADRIVLEKPVETTGSGSATEARRVEVKINP